MSYTSLEKSPDILYVCMYGKKSPRLCAKNIQFVPVESQKKNKISLQIAYE